MTASRKNPAVSTVPRSLTEAQAAEATRAQGQPLDASVREQFGVSLGHDFSRVRVHTDDRHGIAALATIKRVYDGVIMGSVVEDVTGTGQVFNMPVLRNRLREQANALKPKEKLVITITHNAAFPSYEKTDVTVTYEKQTDGSLKLISEQPAGLLLGGAPSMDYVLSPSTSDEAAKAELTCSPDRVF